MNDTINALIDNLTYDNWFTQIAIISDAFRESGDEAKADRCDDFVICNKRPRLMLNFYVFNSRHLGCSGYKRSEIIPEPTRSWLVEAIKMMGKPPWATEDIREPFVAYLTIPQSKRLRRPKK